MAKKLISLDDTSAAGSRLPNSVVTEIAAVPSVAGKYVKPTTGIPITDLRQADLDSRYTGQAYPSVTLGGATTQVLPTAAVVAFGDSLTLSDGSNWPAALADLLGIPVVNRGIAGQGAADIILRQGGFQPLVTLSGNQIPASTAAVSLTAIDPATGWRTSGTGSFGFAGTIAGVAGSLIHDLSTNAWTFTPTAAPGAPVAVPAGTPFISDPAAANPAHHLIMWVGRNNVSPNTLPTARDLIGLAPLNGQKTQVRRYLVIGVTNGQTEGKGTANYIAITAHNALLKARYGKFFYDIRRDVIDTGLAIAGLTATTDDTTAIADDRIPPSLMADSIHFNAAGYGVVKQLIANKVLDLGWVASLTAAVAPTTAPTVTAGTGTATTQALTLSSVSGATSYPTRYRTQGATTWTAGPTASGTTVTLTGLTASTAYEVQAAAANTSGTGPYSSTLAFTTLASSTVLASDSFNRADTTAGTIGTSDAAFGGTPIAWESDGQLQILSNQLGASALSSNRTARLNAAVTDAFVETTVAVMTAQGIGVVGRWVDNNNHYYARTPEGGSGGGIYKRVAGTMTAVATAASQAAWTNSDKIGLEIIGSTLRMFKNGVVVATATDADLTAGTRWGVRSAFNETAMRFDDLRVYSKSPY